jgi:hypothetical protein
MSVPRLNKLWQVLAGSAALFVLTSAAEARPARCFTSDDGPYVCQFAAADRRGSFRISAPGKPTILLNVDQPGTAFGIANFGSRNVALPGRYRRSKADPACWVNDATGADLRGGCQNWRARRLATRKMHALCSSDWMMKPSRS